MTTPIYLSKYTYWPLVLVAVLGLALGSAFAGDKAPPFDFSDDFYRANGINPDAILNRVNGDDGVSVVDETDDPDRRNVRIIETTGGFDASEDLLYYNVFGMVMPETFTDDEAGQEALELANKFRAFIFPKKDGDPLSPAPPNRRQDNIFDTRDGYFSNNPLGLWILVFVSYTDKALNTEEGRDELDKLAQKNGLDLDGTPIIKSASDVDNLADKGLVKLRTRAQDGSQGFPWVI